MTRQATMVIQMHKETTHIDVDINLAAVMEWVTISIHIHSLIS